MDENQLKLLWDSFASNGGGFKDYAEFKDLMGDNNSRKVFFDSYNKDLGFKDYTEFEDILGVKKQKEVSTNGSVNTSGTSKEPSISSTGQQLPSQSEVNKQDNLNQFTGVQKGLLNQETTFDLGTTVNANQAFTGLGQVEEGGLVGTPEEAQLYDSDFVFNLEKSLNNNLNQAKGFGDRILVTTGAFAKKALGEVLASDAYRYAGLDINQVLADATNRLGELSSKNEEVVGFTNAEGFSDYASALTDSALAVGYSYLVSRATMGAGLFTDMIGGSIADYNNTKAQAKGMSVEQLYKSGEADYIAPAILGGIGFALEKVGMRGVQGALTRKIQSGLGKYFTSIALDLNKEGMTEWLQYGLDRVNQHIAEGGEISDSAGVMLDSIFTKEAFEQYLKGVAGTGVLASPNVISATILNNSTRNKALTLDTERRVLIEQLGKDENLNDPVVRDAMLNKINDLSSQIKELYDQDFAKNKEGKPADFIDQSAQLAGRVSDIENKIKTGVDDSGQQITEEAKSALESEKNNLEAQLEDLVKNTPKVERNDARLEELANRLTEITTIQEDPNYTKDYSQKQRAALDAEYNTLIEEYNPLYQAAFQTNQTQTNDTNNSSNSGVDIQQTIPDTTVFGETQESGAINPETGSVGETNQTSELSTPNGLTAESQPETQTAQIESTNEVVAQPTFIQSIRQNISDETKRNTRISELEDRIKNRRSDNNLGIANDPKQQAQYWADVTEYAVLKVADKTIKSVEALGRALGIDSKTPELISAWEDAQKVNTILKEATVKPTTTLKGAIKESTEGGISGKVTITNRQALAQQFKALNRGIKEGLIQVDEAQKTLKNVISELRNRGMLENLTPKQVESLSTIVGNVKNLNQVQTATDRIVKLVNPTESVKSRINRTTDGGTQGEITITTRQALADQIKTLNRGAKDMQQNVKDLSQTIGAYLSANKDKLKGAKIPNSVVGKMVKAVTGVTSEKQLNQTLDVLEKAVNDTEFRTRLSQIELNQKRIKKLASTKGIARDLSNTLNNFSKINPLDLRDVSNIQDYLTTLDSLVNMKKSKSKVDAVTIQKFVDLAEITQMERDVKKAPTTETERTLNKIEKLKTKLTDNLGVSEADVKAIDDRSKPLDEIVADLQAKIDELVPNAEAKLRTVAGEYEAEINANKQEILKAQTNPEERRMIDDFFKQGVTESEISKPHLANYVVSMYNLLNHRSGVGLGMVINEVRQNRALKDKAQVDNVGNMMQTPNKLQQMLDKFGFSSGSQVRDGLVKVKRFIGDLDVFTGYADVQTKSVSAFKQIEAIRKEFNEAVKKHRKDLNDNPVKEVVLTIYSDVVQYRKSWTQEQIKNEFKLRLEAWQESLARMKAVKNSQYQEDNKIIISNLEQALKEIGSPKSSTEIWDKLPQGHKELYSLMRSTFDKYQNKHFAVSRVYGGLDVEQDWVNYIPRSYQDTRTRGQRDNERKLATSSRRISELDTGSYSSSMAKENTGTGKSRLISGNKLPLEKVLNTRIFDTYLNESGAIVYDIETMPERGYTANMLNYKKHGGFKDFEDELPMQIYTAKVNQKLEGDRFAIRTPDLASTALRNFFGKISKLGITNALGGTTQFIKQTSPIFETLGRVKDPTTVFQAIRMMNKPSPELKALLAKGDIAVRAIENEINPPKGSSLRREQKNRNEAIKALRALGIGADKVTDKLADISMLPLKITDSYIAKVGWLALYLDDASQRGNGNVTLGNPIKESIAYANTQNSIVMNESDPSLQASFTKQPWVRMMFPFSGFSINAKMSVINSLSRLKRARSGAEIKQVAGELSGNLANIVAFNIIGRGIRYAAIAGSSYFLYSMLAGSDIPEEEKKKKMEELAKDEENRQALNAIRSTGYLTHDILFGGLFGTYLEPATQPITDLVVNQIWSEDEQQARGYDNSSKSFGEKDVLEQIASVAGAQGIYAKKVYDTWKLGASLLESDKDYVQRRFQQVNAEHTDVFIDDYYQDSEVVAMNALPTWDKATRLTSLLNSTANLFGASEQYLNSTLRYATNISRTLVQKDHGKVSTNSKEELIKQAKKVTNIEIGGVPVTLDYDQKLWYLSNWASEVTKLKEQAPAPEGTPRAEYEKAIERGNTKKMQAEFIAKYPEAWKQAIKEYEQKKIKEGKETQERVNYGQK